jgi:outer membrane protein assembly factor BamA
VVSNAQILSYGGFVAYDSRNNTIGLTRGLDLYARVASAGDFGHHDALTSYGWLEKEFDARAYAPLGSHRTSLLLRSRAQFKTPTNAQSQIPFYDLSWLGGRQYLRGYHSYRFRGNNVALFSSELQQTVLALTGTRGIDLFGSADAGQVWDDRFLPRSWHSGLGGGLQYRHSRAIAVRIEASRSEERTLIYASLSRGF